LSRRAPTHKAPPSSTAATSPPAAVPANGIYDIKLTIYNAATNGSVIGAPITNSAVIVVDGTFEIVLDFGTGIFTGPSRWLETGVRTNGSGAAYTTLIPRYKFTASPYAITASNITGIVSASNSWTATPATNAPSARRGLSGVWTGLDMIVWGGQDEAAGIKFNTGGQYNPDLNIWTATPTNSASFPRNSHNCVWTGCEMIVFGGSAGGSSPYRADPYSYSPNRTLYLYMKP
jgi:hypothetical protein